MAHGSPAHHESERFSAFMASSRRGVLSLWLADLLLRGPFTRERRRVVGLLLVASTPVLVHLAMLPFSQCSLAPLGWIGYFAGLFFLLLLIPDWLWTELVRCSQGVESMLPSTKDSAIPIQAVQRVLNLRRQLVISLLTGAAAVSVFWGLRIQLSGAVELCPMSYVLIFLVASLGINGIYWVWSVPLFISSLLRVERLNLWWHAPAHTPGMRRLSRLLGTSAFLAGVGLVLIEIPILFVTQRLPVQGLLKIVYLAGLLTTVTTFTFVAIYPQLCLSRLGVREKRRIIQEVGEQINAQRAALLEGKNSPSNEELATRVELYDRLISAPAATIAPEAMLRFLTGLGTALLPYILKALGWTL
jgi:hypothetical protein